MWERNQTQERAVLDSFERSTESNQIVTTLFSKLPYSNPYPSMRQVSSFTILSKQLTHNYNIDFCQSPQSFSTASTLLLLRRLNHEMRLFFLFITMLLEASLGSDLMLERRRGATSGLFGGDAAKGTTEGRPAMSYMSQIYKHNKDTRKVCWVHTYVASTSTPKASPWFHGGEILQA